ncbi:MAG: UvrD-helicase domain-containing protein [Chloroflexota bacterium]
MSFTEQQTRAIYTHDRNLIVVAGAGSGKTRVLVERYLALLDANPDWPLGALVAITFTRKAAQEMRDRVRQALETRRNATSTPAERDRWTELAGQIETARIDTIHGLCADILRANAAEAHLDPDFALLDEVESGILFSDIVEATLRRVVDNDLPEVRLLSNYGVDRVRDALLGAVSLRHDRYVKTYQPEAYLAAWAELWQQEVYRALRWFLTEANEIAFPDPLPESDTFAEKIVHARQCVAAVRSTMMHDHNPEEALAVLEELQGISKRGGSIKKWGDEAALSWAKDEFDRLRKLAKDVHGLIGGPLAEHDEIAAQLLPLWGELLRRVHAAFRDYKHSESLLDFDDLEVMTRDLLVHNPEVAARYRGREFRHLLVDEFQDTNAVQWQIVQALSDLESPGSVFVVGDPKQSIYAFRGADVSVFGQVREQITATSAGEHLPLSRSFRTHKPLIDGLNALFSRLLVRDLDSPVASYQVTLGEPLEAHRSTSPTDDPPVELLLIGRESVDGNGDAANLRADDRREWEASEITNRISVLVRSGRLVYDREMADTRPVQFGDVAILFQSLSNVTIYETAFKTAGIPFVTVSGRGYYDRQEVWDLLNLLRALHNPADDLSLASVLRSPMFSVSDDGLLALKLSAQQYDLTLWEALSLEPMPVTGSDGAHADFARRTLDVLRGLSGRVTIAELLHEALAQTGYLAVLTGLPDGARRRGNVEKLIEKAEISERVTLGEFSRYLEDLSAREVREGEAAVDAGNAVTLMTVHASKGL